MDGDRLVELHVAGADGSGLAQLAGTKMRRGAGEIGDWYGPSGAAWSPDGRRVAFNAMTLRPEEDPRTVRTQDWQQGLYVVDVQEGEVRPLRGDFTAGASAAWSPDGRRIVFSRAEPDEFDEVQSDLFELVLATGEERRLTDDRLFEDEPAFSPDGERIAYTVSAFPPGHPDHDEDIAIVQADGSGAVQLLTSTERERSPAWSPDGEAIVAVMGGMGRPGLALVPAAGGTPRPLGADQPGMQAAAQPAWSPDGTLIAFCAPGEARFGLYVIPVHGAGARRGVIRE
jgi:Tol biopolymer transport system component